MVVTVGTNTSSAAHKSEGSTVAFPDVCKTPAPPAPFVPAPYPNTQLEKNLKQANMADAKAKAGNKVAQAQVDHAIAMLHAATGKTASSATQATLIGFTVHTGGNGVVTEGKKIAIADTLLMKNELGSSRVLGKPRPRGR